jgi:hypothetical protein
MPTTNEPKGADLAKDLQAQGIRPGGNTASGQAASPESYEGTNIADTSKEAKGSGDTALKPAKNSPDQSRPAAFVRNGSLPLGNLPSPTGPIPAAVVARDDEDVGRMDEVHRKRVRREQLGATIGRVPDEVLQNASGAELRAFAADRGYDIGDGGRRVLRARFITAQDEDESLAEAKPSAAENRDTKLLESAPNEVRSVGGIPVSTPGESK